MLHKINETNGKFGAKVAVVRYTKGLILGLILGRKAASKQNKDRGLGTSLPSLDPNSNYILFKPPGWSIKFVSHYLWRQ